MTTAIIYQTLIEHWNGTRLEHCPQPERTGANFLNGVSRSAPNDVWAVGNYSPDRRRGRR